MVRSFHFNISWQFRLKISPQTAKKWEIKASMLTQRHGFHRDNRNIHPQVILEVCVRDGFHRRRVQPQCKYRQIHYN
ncbi:unnamed protein product [Photorhabdus laumondii subsp. laumondii TTO1]|uniref:Photorhabdus luminescens subsp. laumondii TTO1 complete genome segment 13/17 n=1 Tax=Photorhabdus laumondii subsp. laumondii (strain DSM 15139 / CIP 105565 / TT01) TaxID=243265 RepID=Q7N178_PHOLL|nr:unnamed protein product [Photorhabdus laumondii subsp. laumondii TTO1]